MEERIPPARVAAIRRRLLRWWEVARRDLPWRLPAGAADPYRVWVSEAMLQQTQVATVIPYYRRFLGRFPTLPSLAEAEEGDVLALWSGLGYYARARALLRAAREAMARHGGLPATVEALRQLPGFGPYTAGAVASIAFGVRTPAVDGNAGRVLARLLLVGDDPRSPRFRDRVWAGAESLVRGTLRGGPVWPGELNQALIELGALVCRPRNPGCGECPLEAQCRARRAGRERTLPRAHRRPAPRRLRIAVGVCTRGGRVLLVRRPASGLFAGMWAPPSVELSAGEDAGAAISSAIDREPSAKTGGFVYVGKVERTLTHRALELEVFSAEISRLPRKRGDWMLAGAAELGSLGVPAAMRRVLTLTGVGEPSGGASRK